MTDRKIELENLTEDVFQQVLTAVNSDVLKIAKEAQDKINLLLIRFNIKCSLSLAYQLTDPSMQFMEKLPDAAPDAPEIEAPKPEKKKRAPRKKKASSPA